MPRLDPIPVLNARRILSRVRASSSLPVIAETEAGPRFVKLRGAAHGTTALTAEMIVADLAALLGLSVPRRSFVVLEPGVPSEDRDQELGDLLRASRGVNLGFELLEGARDLEPPDVAAFDEDLASRIVWLDGLVMNADRTAESPNLLVRGRAAWLVDHGSALPFHHDWKSLTEDTPRRGRPACIHVLAARASRLEALDPILAARLSREALAEVLARVPDDFLVAPGEDAERRRALYVAFLWKRLKPPRPFLGEPEPLPPPGPGLARGVRPDWLRRS